MFSYSMKMKGDDVVRGLSLAERKGTEVAVHGGQMVLPMTVSTSLSLSTSNADHHGQSEGKNKNLAKGDKKAKLAILRMKELLRRAAIAAKTQKTGKYIGQKVLVFRNKGSFKGTTSRDDDQLCYDSPLISLRWDPESFTTTSSGISTSLQRSPKKSTYDHPKNSTPLHGIDEHLWRQDCWITTDSEFVVLELGST